MISLNVMLVVGFTACLFQVRALVITSETPYDANSFPLQYPNPESNRSFFRKYPADERIEKIYCPFGTVFDVGRLVCVKNPNDDGRNEYRILANGLAEEACKGAAVNELRLNPENCRTFFNCGPGCAHEQPCSAYLLFRIDTSKCDYPLIAGCCEYWEKHSDRIVQ